MKRLKKIRLTEGKGNDQLLYFHSASFLKDDSGIVFIRTIGRSPNIFFRELVTGFERQLTWYGDGYLKSYIDFDGELEKGFGRTSVTFDSINNLVYFIYGQKICSVDLEGNIRKIAELPQGQVTAYTAVSQDGQRLCVPTTDAGALHEVKTCSSHLFQIDHKIREQNLNSYLRIYDIKTGRQIDCQKIPQAWVTHVSFCPQDENTILYNHEWASVDMGVRRMWIWDGKRHRRLREENELRNRNDFVCHEVWERNGEFIIYHGRYVNGVCFLGRVDSQGENTVEIEFPSLYQREGHFCPGKDGFLVTDGLYENKHFSERIRQKIQKTLGKSEAFCGKYITFIKVDWNNRKIEWFPLCRHGSDWSTQDSHPHPLFNTPGSEVYFNSNRHGKNSIYRISVPVSFYG